MRLEEVVVGAKSVGDVVWTTFLRAHGPSNSVGVDPQQGLVLSEDLLGRKAGMGDALGAPAREAEAGAVEDAAAGADVGVAADVGVDAAADGILEQEDRALAHDGDDRVRDAVARAQREKASAELKSVR